MHRGQNYFSGLRPSYFTPKDADEGSGPAALKSGSICRPVWGWKDPLIIAAINSEILRPSNLSCSGQLSLRNIMPSVPVWSPFLLGGGGWYYTEVDGPDNFSHTGLPVRPACRSRH